MTREQAVAAAQELDAQFLVRFTPKRETDGLSCGHLRWMVEQMTAGMSENKTQRWLGYIQGALVVSRIATLDQMKDVSKRAVSV